MANEVKRDGRQLYFLFVYDEYYPVGGISDYKGTFESIDEAEAYVNQHLDEFRGFDNIELAGLAMDGELIDMGAFELIGGRLEFVSRGISRNWDG